MVSDHKEPGIMLGFHMHFVTKSDYLSYRGKNSSSEKLNNLPKGIQPVSVDLELTLGLFVSKVLLYH